jgi:hypothetical protein
VAEAGLRLIAGAEKKIAATAIRNMRFSSLTPYERHRATQDVHAAMAMPL